ncbi:MAG TPA: rhomboid family intramembrane serine protease [Polyangiaceae bacterium]|nr:rhomboid family intramembrane serine protease [Polyangiaceae bacterium]
MGSRVCRACGGLNGEDEARCYRCGKPLAGMGPSLNELFNQPAIATRILLALCCVDFAYLVWVNGSLPLAIIGPGPSLESMVRSGALFLDFASREPWRLLAAVYSHLGVLHLGMNMMALVQFGRAIEDRLGSARLVVLFTVTGIVGFLASMLWYGPESPPTAGASGALFGFVGYLIGVLHARKDPNTRSIVMQQLAYAVAFALLVPVNNAAHLGGFVSGFAAGRLFHLERNPHRAEPVFRVLAVLSLLAAVASMVLSATSPLGQLAHAYDLALGR